MQDWQVEHKKLTEQNLQAIKCGQFASGYALFRHQKAQRFDVPLNPAVRQFNKFVAKHPGECIAMTNLLGIKFKTDLRAYEKDERMKIAKFILVAKVIVEFFYIPTLFKHFTHLE
jgi:hypothetical protein|nr:MAG TPA: hypothetical protein [Caudoviricetes sp.]